MYIGADNFQVLVLERNSWFKGKFTIKKRWKLVIKNKKMKGKKNIGDLRLPKKNMGASKALKYVDTRRSLAPCDDSVSLYISVIFQHYTANVKQNGQ